MRTALDKRGACLAAATALGAAVCVAAGSAQGASPGAISTVAGTGSPGYLLDGVPATGAQLREPGDVAPTPDGAVLIADTENDRVRRVSPAGTITTVAGNGAGGYNGELLPATLSSLNAPAGVAALPSGAFLVADRDNNRIRRVGADGAIVTVAGQGSDGGGGDGGPATQASLHHPDDIAPTPDGGYLIADTGNDRIRKVEASGVIRTVAGRSGGSGKDDDDDDDDKGIGDGGPATQAALDAPKGVAALPAGGFLVADTGNDRIRRVDASGVISTVAGKSSSGFSGEGVPATAAKLSEPVDVSVTAGNGFIFADSRNNRVRYVSPAGRIETLAGSGSAGFNGDGMPATSAQLNAPRGVASSPAGTLVYVADTLNNRVRSLPFAFVEAPVNTGGGAGTGQAPPASRAPAPPIAGKTVNVAPVRGRVRFKKPKARGFESLRGAASVPVGSTIDTRAGRVRLTSAANLSGRVQTAEFYDGAFTVRQRRTRRPITSLRLRGGMLASCRRSSRSRPGARAAASARSARRGLWGSGHGRFRTRGRRSAATVRGTIWFTQDRCDGTLVRVKRGVVAVRDFSRRRTVRVRAGSSYLARARPSPPDRKR